MHQFHLLVAVVVGIAALVRAEGTGCGGVLEGEYGRFQYPASPSKPARSASSCLWTIQLPYGSDIKFTLDTFESNSQLVLYNEQNPTKKALSSVRLNASDVGSPVEFKGKTLTVILPNTNSVLSFTWESLSENRDSAAAVAVNYIDTAEGILEWRQRRPSERLTCAISTPDSTKISWRTTVESYSCDSEDPCQCFYFGIFEVAPTGSLIEAGRICGKASSEGTFENSSPHVVAFVYTNVVELSVLNKLEISWQSQPRDENVDISAATSEGLLAIPLDTLNATVIASPVAYGVAFDTKTGKLIWSEYDSIKRAYPNGTELQVLRNGTEYVFAIAIDPLSGNVYYGDYGGNRILACNNELENCVTLATSSVVDSPSGMALNIHRRQVYWTNRGTMNSISKANFDGSDATTILVGLKAPAGIVVDNDEGRIYWIEEYSDIIGTSNLEGGRRSILIELPGTAPFGLAMHRNWLYVGNFYTSNVQSVNKYTGSELTTEYSAKGQVRHVAIIDPGTTRIQSYEDNPCQGNACSHLCVPAVDSYRCLCPENMYLGGKGMACL